MQGGTVVVLQVRMGSALTGDTALALCQHSQYAARHGYSYQLCSGTQPPLEDTAPAWVRLPVMGMLLQRPEVSWVLYMDADLQVVDHRHGIGRLLRRCGRRAELIITSDSELIERERGATKGSACCSAEAEATGHPPCTCLVNSGLLLFRNSPWVRAFVARMLSSPRCEPYRNQRQWDQDCLQLSLLEAGLMPSLSTLRRALSSPAAPAALDASGRVCVLPQAWAAAPMPCPREMREAFASGGRAVPQDYALTREAGQALFRRAALALDLGRARRLPRDSPAIRQLPFALHALAHRCCRAANCSGRGSKADLLRAMERPGLRCTARREPLNGSLCQIQSLPRPQRGPRFL